jgi:hypothetical protein
MTITQETIQKVYDDVSIQVSHYHSGLITTIEFVNAVSNIAQPILDANTAELKGLIDINTGLRY